MNLKVGDKVIKTVDTSTTVPKGEIGVVDSLDSSRYYIKWQSGKTGTYNRDGSLTYCGPICSIKPYQVEIDLSKAKRVRIRTVDDMCHDSELKATVIGEILHLKKEGVIGSYTTQMERSIPKDRIVKIENTLLGGPTFVDSGYYGDWKLHPFMIEEVVEYLPEEPKMEEFTLDQLIEKAGLDPKKTRVRGSDSVSI